MSKGECQHSLSEVGDPGGMEKDVDLNPLNMDVQVGFQFEEWKMGCG